MKYVFIVQGEGRGHLTQAITLCDMLRRNGHEVLEVLVGMSRERVLPHFFSEKMPCPVRPFDTLTFRYKKNKKEVNLFYSILYNAGIRQLNSYRKSIEYIHARLQLLCPDAVISFYEILSGMTQLRYRMNIPFINIGHQFLLLRPDYAFGKDTRQEHLLLRLHVLANSVGASCNLALSFYPMPNSEGTTTLVMPPLLRREIVQRKPEKGDFVLVYMLNAGYYDEVCSWHALHPEVKLRCFWDKKDMPARWKVDDTLEFCTVDDRLFIESISCCRAYVSTAGFESVCEAFYLGKPVMVIPAHVEQEINAQDAASTGYCITGNRFDISRLLDFAAGNAADTSLFRAWVDSAEQRFIDQLARLTERPASAFHA